MTFCTQVVRASFGGGLGIGSGGPKKQFASGRQEVAPPPQSASVEQESGLVWVPALQMPAWHAPATLPQSASEPQWPLTQCLPGPEPLVQSFGPVPALPPSVPGPVMEKVDVAPSGISPGGTIVALPPPKYRQPRPRVWIAVVHPVSEKTLPESGAAAAGLNAAPPQLVVPGAVLNFRTV